MTAKQFGVADKQCLDAAIISTIQTAKAWSIVANRNDFKTCSKNSTSYYNIVKILKLLASEMRYCCNTVVINEADNAKHEDEEKYKDSR